MEATHLTGGDHTAEGRKTLSLIRTIFEGWTVALSSLGTILIFGLMVLINADVIGRELFNKPISGVPEIVRLSIVGIVFLQISHALLSGRITRSTALIDFVRRRAPKVAAGLETFYAFTGAALFAFIFWASYPILLTAIRDMDYVGSAGVFTAPVWPVKLLILLGSATMILAFASVGLKALGTFRKRAV